MKTVVMTGGTSGLGRVAAQQMFETPDKRLLLGVRAKREFDCCSPSSRPARRWSSR